MTAPTSPDSLRIYHSPSEIEQQITTHMQSHPLIQSLLTSPKWRQLRPHHNFPDDMKKYNLTASTLLGPNKFPVPPLIYSSDKELISLVYAGTNLSGHPGLVHGGALATLLDEGLAWCGFNALPNHLGVTAFLNIRYRKPVPVGKYLCLRAEITKSEGRKVWVKGTIEVLGEGEKAMERGKVCVEAEGLYVEPKWVKWMPRWLM